MHRLKTMKDALIGIAECALADADRTNTEELGEVIDMVKDLEQAMYYCLKVKELECEMEEKEKMNHYVFIPYQQEERDMDRHEGRMYYTEPRYRTDGRYPERPHSEREVPMSLRDSREGRSPMSRRNYMESKELHKDKEHKVKELEKYMQELSQDIVEMIEDASPEEKQMLEKKMTNLASKVAQLNRNA